MRHGTCALALLCAVTVACHSKSAPATPEPQPPRVESPAPPPPPPPAAPAQPIAETGLSGGAVGIAMGGAARVGSGSGYGVAARRPMFGVSVPWNTEAYDHIADNNWKLVGNDPLSTFSVDVDTASYANMRRFLNGGQPSVTFNRAVRPTALPVSNSRISKRKPISFREV